MDSLTNTINGGGGAFEKKSFIQHVFSTTEEGKSEILNVLQYGLLGIIPVVLLNKAIQKFIPEADPCKSSLEIGLEILIQLAIILIGIVIIHRIITFVSPYSGFPYSHLLLTNSILTFLVIVLSIQTKIGIKVNILFERLVDLWNGTDSSYLGSESQTCSDGRRVRKHVSSKADTLDETPLLNQPLPVNTKSTKNETSGSVSNAGQNYASDPAPANSFLGNNYF